MTSPLSAPGPVVDRGRFLSTLLPASRPVKTGGRPFGERLGHLPAATGLYPDPCFSEECRRADSRGLRDADAPTRGVGGTTHRGDDERRPGRGGTTGPPSYSRGSVVADRLDQADQAVLVDVVPDTSGAAADAGGEDQRARRADHAVAEGDAPQARVDDRHAVGVAQDALEVPAVPVVGLDHAVVDVAD